MRILVTNDDGINASGLSHLVRVARHFGEVKVVAPESPKSACGHGMTIRDPLRVSHAKIDGLDALMVNGLPVDCVNVGLTVCWPEGCDLVLSGINDGPNLGYDVTYSGTVAATMEAVINEIPGIALSMAAFRPGAPQHFETGAQWLGDNWEMLTSLKAPDTTFWNVNVPAVEHNEIKGYRFCRLGGRIYTDRVEKRTDPSGRDYFWQGGEPAPDTTTAGTDTQAIAQGYVSITPVSIDWTDVATLKELGTRSQASP